MGRRSLLLVVSYTSRIDYPNSDSRPIIVILLQGHSNSDPSLSMDFNTDSHTSPSVDMDIDPYDLFRDDDDHQDDDYYQDTNYHKDMVVYLIDASPKVFNYDTVSAKRAGSKLRSRIVAEQSISKWCQMIEQLEDQVSEVLQEERQIKRKKLIFILLSVVFPNH
ncbi:hypothetical protein MKX03_026218 [Papaver bracteatum]|nr:hypothetical protein MKX03_026218 [Papaver bracteatum]